MIVDLVRNDLGRVCRPGTVTADVVADPRAHTGVWHLVSEVSGRLAPGADNAALVRAAFPPGSVTGAPKVAALNVISELESTSRHVYTGAIGFASPLAGLELNVAIRTFEFAADHERAWLGVGGGIVADSDPAAEAAECLTKATPLLDAIGASVAADDDRRPTPDHDHRRTAASADPGTCLIPPRHAPRPIPRPDPAAGVFETLLVEHGHPIALDEHLARLAHSMTRAVRAGTPVRPRPASPKPRRRPRRTRARTRARQRQTGHQRRHRANRSSRSRTSRFADSRRGSIRSSSPAVSAPTSGSTGACSTPSERRPIRSSAISTARSWKRPAPTSSS